MANEENDIHSSAPEIGSVVDAIEQERLRAMHTAYELGARALELREKAQQELDQASAAAAVGVFVLGPAVIATPAFYKAVAGVCHGVQANRRERKSREVMPYFEED